MRIMRLYQVIKSMRQIVEFPPHQSLRGPSTASRSATKLRQKAFVLRYVNDVSLSSRMPSYELCYRFSEPFSSYKLRR